MKALAAGAASETGSTHSLLEFRPTACVVYVQEAGYQDVGVPGFSENHRMSPFISSHSKFKGQRPLEEAARCGLNVHLRAVVLHLPNTATL